MINVLCYVLPPKVVARYRVCREVLVVLKYINSGCRYMTLPTLSWMFSHDTSLVSGVGDSEGRGAISRKQHQDQQEGDKDAWFSYEVPRKEEDWQVWALAKWVHPALMEAMYRG